MGIDATNQHKSVIFRSQTFLATHLLIVLFVSTIALLERGIEVLAPSGIAGIDPLIPALIAYASYLVWIAKALARVANHGTRCSNTLFAIGWITLAILYVIIYPLADSGALGFLSDRDEAINIAVKALLDGRYPYDCRVLPGIHSGCPDSGNPIGPMPGAYLFAAPLVLLFGSAASLSLMAVAVVFFGLRAYWNRADNSLICLLGLLLTMPVSGADILTGGDHFANTVFVSIPLILLIQEPSRKYALGLAFLLGCALSWRGLFWMAMVPTLMFFIRQGLIKETLRLGISCSVGFLLVTLPLWLWNPAGFSPLQVQQRYNLYQHIMPHAGLIIPVCTLTLGLFLGWRAKTRDGLYIACGWVLLLPILIGAMFNSIELGRPTLLFYGWYSLTSLFFFTIPYLSAKFKS